MENDESRTIHPVDAAPEALRGQCEVRRVRRSGPGGQHRNKVETGIVLHHSPTGVQAEANERRSQSENLAVALGRLRRTLALEVRCARDAEDVPSPLWRRRCSQGRISINPEHSDVAPLLAEALDVLSACEFDVGPASERLACTPSQLVKFLKLEPRALELVNARRLAAGRHRLK